jgi:hypothetical protein
MIETLISCTSASCVILKLFVLALLLPTLVVLLVVLGVKVLSPKFQSWSMTDSPGRKVKDSCRPGRNAKKRPRLTRPF